MKMARIKFSDLYIGSVVIIFIYSHRAKYLSSLIINFWSTRFRCKSEQLIQFFTPYTSRCFINSCITIINEERIYMQLHNLIVLKTLIKHLLQSVTSSFLPHFCLQSLHTKVLSKTRDVGPILIFLLENVAYYVNT